MAINAKKIFDRLENQKEPAKGRIALYITTQVYKEFRKACGKHPTSNIVEEMMKDFIESAKSAKD